jgi:hypothetical protein
LIVLRRSAHDFRVSSMSAFMQSIPVEVNQETAFQ